MGWRVIPYVVGEPAWNMALDEAMLEALIAGRVPPTLRFYGWSYPAVTIGRLQKLSSVPEGWGSIVVRRPTGGRAVVHGEDLTFSIVVGAELLGSRVGESYRGVAEAVAAALVTLGVPAEFCRNRTAPGSVRMIGSCFDLSLEYELAVEGTKVLGSAQVRRSGAVLQQNSLVPANGRAWPEKEEVARAIVQAFEAGFRAEISPGAPSGFELELARELAAKKYASDAWNRGSRVGCIPRLW